MDVDRRALLRALGALPAFGAAPAWAAAGDAAASSATATGASSATAGTTIAQFAALSATLTGYPAGDPGDAAKMLKAFATPARRRSLQALAKLVAATPAEGLDAALKLNQLDGIANDLVGAWFSGIVTNPPGPDGVAKGQILVLYTNAYVWAAMTFSKPMGVCGGPTNYWAQPPQ
ncbi:MAG: sugar dehydrogenase complex small subunit [Alphaproteobacteria bacterium]